MASLQGLQLAQLVDFLDEVRSVPLTFRRFTKRTPQALTAISVNDNISRQRLYRLQNIRGQQAASPSSYIISSEIARVGDDPIALSAIADAWESTHRNKNILIKYLRAPLTDSKALKKVRILCGTFLSCLLKNTCGPRSYSSKRLLCGKVTAPEQRPFHRRYKESCENRFGLDAEQN